MALTPDMLAVLNYPPNCDNGELEAGLQNILKLVSDNLQKVEAVLGEIAVALSPLAAAMHKALSLLAASPPVAALAAGGYGAYEANADNCSGTGAQGPPGSNPQMTPLFQIRTALENAHSDILEHLARFEPIFNAGQDKLCLCAQALEQINASLQAMLSNGPASDGGGSGLAGGVFSGVLANILTELLILPAVDEILALGALIFLPFLPEIAAIAGILGLLYATFSLFDSGKEQTTDEYYREKWGQLNPDKRKESDSTPNSIRDIIVLLYEKFSALDFGEKQTTDEYYREKWGQLNPDKRKESASGLHTVADVIIFLYEKFTSFDFGKRQTTDEYYREKWGNLRPDKQKESDSVPDSPEGRRKGEQPGNSAAPGQNPESPGQSLEFPPSQPLSVLDMVAPAASNITTYNNQNYTVNMTVPQTSDPQQLANYISRQLSYLTRNHNLSSIG